MFYVRQISTDADTSKANATETRIKAWGGIITKISVRFPPGPQFLLHCSISQGGHQIFPVDENFDVTGENEAVTTDEYYKMQSGYNLILVRTWNDDDTYAHSCLVRITVLPQFVATPYFALRDIATSLRFILRRIGLKV